MRSWCLRLLCLGSLSKKTSCMEGHPMEGENQLEFVGRLWDGRYWTFLSGTKPGTNVLEDSIKIGQMVVWTWARRHHAFLLVTDSAVTQLLVSIRGVVNTHISCSYPFLY